VDHASELFVVGNAKSSEEAQTDRLYQQIGQLKVELDWLKKKSGRLR
jgi:hypothetical protein